MDRRSFLRQGSRVSTGSLTGGSRGTIDGDMSSWRKGGDQHDSLLSAGDLTPYTPRPDKPWNAQRAAHLLHRTGFGATWGEIQAIQESTPAVVVQAMLSAGASVVPPGTWATQLPFPNPVSNAQLSQYYTWARDMQEWWTGLMLDQGTMLREKMVLFWHNHFVSEFLTVYVTQYMYMQNQLYRTNAFGSFKDLSKKVTIDPAMLIYLDGATSRAGNPNENYARELLELFCIGVGNYSDGTPHYTEADVVQLARALTGWTVNPNDASRKYATFMPARFDSSNKTIFGQIANYGIEGKTPNDVIDLIFDQVDKDQGQKRASIFICEKLYQFFVYDHPDMEIVKGMAQTLEANNWAIGPVLQQLLTSEHFFDENIIGARIKSPAEFTLGTIHTLGLQEPMDRNRTSAAQPEAHDPVTSMSYLSQMFLYPPNVKGWIGGRSWLSSATVPLRIRYTKMWIEPVAGALAYGFDPVAFIKTLPDYDDAEKLIDNLLLLLLPFTVSVSTRALILDELLLGAPVYEWDPDAPNSAVRIRSAMIRIANLGEYQLV